VAAVRRFRGGLNPEAVGRALAVSRIGAGTAFLVAPRVLFGLFLRVRPPSDEAVAAVRMFAGRDVALGLGALLAARRGPGRVRGWLEAGALADASDVLAFAPASALRPAARWGVVTIAGAAAALASVVARRL
jgi:hypothetical protein